MVVKEEKTMSYETRPFKITYTKEKLLIAYTKTLNIKIII